ncbi:uncharacterized protein [Euwallacea similis]|uniref:uncharacterized protein n=1 Tax=Euwallacea similis TaxID=1736056 RepID=UPI00344E6FB7
MFKNLMMVFLSVLAFSTASPVADPKAQYIVDPYVLPAVAPLAYSAPLYSDYVLPSVYASGYAYSPYVAAAPAIIY